MISLWITASFSSIHYSDLLIKIIPFLASAALLALLMSILYTVSSTIMTWPGWARASARNCSTEWHLRRLRAARRSRVATSLRAIALQSAIVSSRVAFQSRRAQAHRGHKRRWASSRVALVFEESVLNFITRVTENSVSTIEFYRLFLTKSNGLCWDIRVWWKLRK